MSENGKLYSVNIKDGTTHLRVKLKIVDYFVNVQSLKADEDDNKGINLSVQRSKSIYLKKDLNC